MSLRWTLFLILAIPCGLLILLNWITFVRWMMKEKGKRGSFSFAPPWLCGVVGAIALLVSPNRLVQELAWVPIGPRSKHLLRCGTLFAWKV